MKHKWTYEEDILCCKLYYDIFVKEKRKIGIDAFVSELLTQLPNIKSNSIKMKVQNIKKILMDLDIEDSLVCTGLANYSKQNLKAMNEVLFINRK